MKNLLFAFLIFPFLGHAQLTSFIVRSGASGDTLFALNPSTGEWTQLTKTVATMTGQSGKVLSNNGSVYTWVTPFDGNYNSLSNKPTIPGNTNQLVNGAGFITGYTETDPLSVKITDSASMLSKYLRSNLAAATYQPIGNYVTAGQPSYSANGSGTAYSLTATSSAITMGTGSTSITIATAGTYRIRFYIRTDYNAATLAVVRNVTYKLRRTNNTATDITNGSIGFKTAILTLLTYSCPFIVWECDYTASAGDVIQLFGGIDVVPTAGNVQVIQTYLKAEKAY